MSEAFPYEAAAGQAGQTAAVALQTLVLMAQAVREHQRRQAAGEPAPPQRTLDQATERYALAVREKIGPAELADALVNGPGWPRLAEELRQLELSGVDVRQFLADAAPLVARIDADLRAAIAPPGLAVTAQARRPDNVFPLPRPERRTIGDRLRSAIDRVQDRLQPQRVRPSALRDRAAALAREGIGPQQNARLVIAAREAIGDEQLLGQLVVSRGWPGIAGQMQRRIDAGVDPREALAGVPVRVQQAAAAGISLTAAEAAQGLLSQPSTTAAPAQAPAVAESAPAPAASGPAPAAAAPSIAPTVAAAPSGRQPGQERAAAATAQSATPAAAPASRPEAARTTAGPKRPATQKHTPRTR